MPLILMNSMTQNKKERADQIQNSIRKIFLCEWDPIRIKDEPNAQDEYDGYIGGLYRILANEGTTDEIVDYLYKIETERMGFSVNREDLIPVANKLKRIDVKL